MTPAFCKMATLLAELAAVSLLTISVPALADHRERGERHERFRDHEMQRFHEHDLGVWRRGHWFHGDHGGRLGWWWVAAGMWYLYPQPVRPYPNPYAPPEVIEAPVVVVPQAGAPASPPAAPEFWYYCTSVNSYYPYAATCPEGWRKVPATSGAH